MTPEEQLDHLIEQRQSDWAPPRAPTNELAVRLAAAETLSQLEQIEPPPELADRLEARLRAQARRQGRQNGRVFQPPSPAPRAERKPFFFRRAWASALVMAAVLLLACGGAFTAAAGSLPGDPLYGVKQFEHQVALAFAGDSQDHAQEEITQLRSAVADLLASVNGGRSDDAIRQALAEVAAKTTDSLAAVAALPAGPDHDSAQHDLQSALHDEDQTLRQLLGRVDWSLRLAFTGQLGALGDAVPAVTKVQITHQVNGARLITLTGANFAPGAQVVINGRIKGAVSQSSPTQLVVVVAPADWPHDLHAVGVLNPDGTTAQALLQNGDDEQPGGDDQHGQTTPGATGTPESGDDHGGHGGGGGSGGPGSTPNPTGTPDN